MLRIGLALGVVFVVTLKKTEDHHVSAFLSTNKKRGKKKENHIRPIKKKSRQESHPKIVALRSLNLVHLDRPFFFSVSLCFRSTIRERERERERERAMKKEREKQNRETKQREREREKEERQRKKRKRGGRKKEGGK